ncbi:hypothetical protein JCM11491_006734 [Sporobolomyces phaffii]
MLLSDTTVARPHATLTTLVPFLFSPDDSLALPPSLVSKPALQAHHYLSLSPADDRYWTLGSKDSQVALARREIVESGEVDSIELGAARYFCDPSEEASLKSLVPVSLPGATPILDVILLYEPADSPTTESDEGAPGEDTGEWRLFKLSAPSIVLESPNNGFHALVQGGNSSSSVCRRRSVAQGQWADSIDDAIAQATDKPAVNVGTDETQTVAGRARPSGLDFSNGEDEGQDEYDEYGTRRRTGTSRVKTREEMAEGEGTTPGAYGDSNDFWAGWSDSEEENEADSGVGFVNDTRGRDTEKEDDDEYWGAYGGVTNQVDDGRREDLVQESPVIGYGGETSAAVAPPADSPSKVKTRSRRSSTVTPFNLSTLSSTSAPAASTPPTNDEPRDRDVPHSSSFLTFDSPAQSSAPFTHDDTASATTVAPPLASAVKLASVTGQDVASNASAGEDDSLRFALAGIWGLYKGSVEGREERRRKFERIAGEVLRS